MALKRKKRSIGTKPSLGRKFFPGLIRIIFSAWPVIIIAAALTMSAKAGQAFFLNSELFAVRSITISGAEPGQIMILIEKDLSLIKGTNIFDVDLKGCETALQHKYPELKGLKVTRLLPDTIDVSYGTRTALCQVFSNGYYLVSDDGMILPGRRPDADPALTVVTGLNITESGIAQGKYTGSKALKHSAEIVNDMNDTGFLNRFGPVESVNIQDPGNPAIIMADGTRIELGEYALRDKFRQLAKVLDDLKVKQKSAKAIDLRFEDVVVIPK